MVARVSNGYVFRTLRGSRSLAQLFGRAKELVVYHLALEAGTHEASQSSVFWADHFASLQRDLPASDIAFKVISPAPLNEILGVRRRMGWQFDWISSHGSPFNMDCGVRGRDGAETPGISVFRREDGEIYRTYFKAGRGTEVVDATYDVLDSRRTSDRQRLG